MTSTKYRYWAIVCLLFSSIVQAQEREPISTERPSFSLSPIALQSDAWQIELGYQYTNDGSDSSDHTLPLMLLRYGFTENAEMQLSWTGYSWKDEDGRSSNGANDPSIGVKWQLSDDGAVTPIALFTGASLPVGSDDFGSDSAEPLVGLFWSHAGRIGLFGTAIVTESGNDMVIGNAVGVDIPTSGNYGAYVEYFSIFQQHNGPEHNLNGGILFLHNIDLQFDITAGIGLNDRAPDFYLGAGVAQRF